MAHDPPSDGGIDRRRFGEPDGPVDLPLVEVDVLPTEGLGTADLVRPPRGVHAMGGL
ncbi:hypothetical protein [Streptomyces sp900116325]|uniref:hypothetical protein n=1 Tax=Streptomyces sp. 900116325 TaxID=3154295 RepID=UPI0033CB9C67